MRSRILISTTGNFAKFLAATHLLVRAFSKTERPGDSLQRENQCPGVLQSNRTFIQLDRIFLSVSKQVKYLTFVARQVEHVGKFK